MSRGIPKEEALGSKKQPYVRIADRAAVGEYELIDPLDYKVLEVLPEEDAMFAGLYPLGETAQAISKKFDGVLDSHQVAQRLRVLSHQGLAVKKKALGSAETSIWQRTATGKEVFETWLKHSS